MEKTTHTPGPWSTSKDQDARGRHGWRIDSASRDLMAWAAWPSEAERDSIEAESTARLIAAAPDMLDALQSLVDMAATFPTELHKGHPEVLAARAALAKARGE